MPQFPQSQLTKIGIIFCLRTSLSSEKAYFKLQQVGGFMLLSNLYVYMYIFVNPNLAYLACFVWWTQCDISYNATN